MSMIDQLRADQLAARKEKDADKAGLLTSLVSEAAMVGKNKGNRESTDEEVIGTIRKFLKNAEETAALLTKNAPSSDGMTAEETPLRKVNREIRLLQAYLPQQMDEHRLRAVITAFKTANAGANMGSVMKFLKENHAGTYDGKLASTVAKEVLS